MAEKRKEDMKNVVCVCEGEKASGKEENVNVSGGEVRKHAHSTGCSRGLTHAQTHIYMYVFTHMCVTCTWSF